MPRQPPKLRNPWAQDDSAWQGAVQTADQTPQAYSSQPMNPGMAQVLGVGGAAPAQAPAQPAGQGIDDNRGPSGWVNLQTYLGLNKDSANRDVSKIAAPVEKQAGDAANALTKANETFKSQADANTQTYNDPWAKAAAAKSAATAPAQVTPEMVKSLAGSMPRRGQVAAPATAASLADSVKAGMAGRTGRGMPLAQRPAEPAAAPAQSPAQAAPAFDPSTIVDGLRNMPNRSNAMTVAEAEAKQGTAYNGPSSLQDIDPALAGQTSAAADKVGLATSDSGRGSLLNDAYGSGGQYGANYGTGDIGLDKFLTGQTGGERFKAIGDKYGGLESALGLSEAGAEKYGANARATTEDSARRYGEILPKLQQRDADMAAAAETRRIEADRVANIKATEESNAASDAEYSKNHENKLEHTQQMSDDEWAYQMGFDNYDEWVRAGKPQTAEQRKAYFEKKHENDY